MSYQNNSEKLCIFFCSPTKAFIGENNRTKRKKYTLDHADISRGCSSTLLHKYPTYTLKIADSNVEAANTTLKSLVSFLLYFQSKEEKEKENETKDGRKEKVRQERRVRVNILPHHPLNEVSNINGMPFKNPPHAMMISPPCLCLELVFAITCSWMKYVNGSINYKESVM